jgi:hypothetical protein
VIQLLIDRRGYRSYLEIGCDRNATFGRVRAARKQGVDPVRGGTVRATSDEFFRQNADVFDVVFVDGLHERRQVLRDVDSSLRFLNRGGCIVLHDCLPKEEHHQLVPRVSTAWTGDVWKAAVALRQRPSLDLATLDAGWGYGVLFARPNGKPLAEGVRPEELTWRDYCENRGELLRIIAPSELDEFIGP